MQTEDAPPGEAVAGSARAVPQVQAPRESPVSAFLEWVLRFQRLAALRKQLASTPALGRSFEKRARQAAALGRAAQESELRGAGTADAVACELYRQATYWALRALSAVNEPRGALPEDHSRALTHPEAAQAFGALFDRVDRPLLLEASGGASALADLREMLIAHDFTDFSELSSEEQTRVALSLERFVARLLSVLEQPRWQVALVELQRWIRLGGVLLFFVVFGGGAFFLAELREQKRDWAREKPYRTSSSQIPGCPSPLQHCDQSPNFFFHTDDQKDPWVEIDLGAHRSFSAVRVVNRRECCFDRASPLLIEVSTDQKVFRKVAERKGPFRAWKAQFAPIVARWVRVRVQGRGVLHLAAVRVLP